jgi:hypothetical protein
MTSRTKVREKKEGDKVAKKEGGEGTEEGQE